MGFGKKSKGKKDKKDKGRKGKQDEWTFEGGSKYVEKKETHDERGKLLHRNTQEKDEKERRGLLKMMDNNRKRAIEQKMANKVKFQDFLSKVEDGSDSEGETDAQRQKKQRKEIAAGQKSSLTVLQRLQKFSTGKSSTHKDTLISQFMTEDDSDSSEEEEAEDEEHANDNNNNVSDEDVEDMEEEDEESEKEEVEEEVEEELDSDEEGNEGAEDKSPYSWFFDSENTSNQTAAADTSSGSKNKNTLTTVEMEAQGGGKIDFSIVGPASGTLVPTPYNKIVATSDKEKQKGLNKAAPVALRSISNMIGHAPPKIFRSVEKLENSTTASASAFAAPVTQKLLPYLSTYADMMIEGRDYKNDNKILTATLTHVCTHIMKARSKVLRHNTKLKKKMLDSIAKRGGDKEKDKQHKQHSGKDKSWITDKNENGGDAVDVDAGDRQITNTTLSDHTQQVQEQEQEDEIEEENDAETDKGTNNTNYDQGFVRPRVLILCPYRGVALKIVDKIRTILGENTTVANLDKFHEEFGSVDYGDGDNSDTDSDSDSDNNNDNNNGEGKKEKNKKKKKKGPPPRPADWNADFQQNVDDDFKLGIQINPGKGKGSGSKKGAYLRLFSDFYISDIILASPLGLRFILERASGSKDKDKDKKGGENGNDDGNDEGSDDENMQTEEKDEAASDFLSSLEVVMAHQADVMYMQNWDHVSFCLDRTNLMPKSNHDTDFSRVRPYFLDPGMSCTRRQMIMTSSFSEPSIQACFRTHARSIAGQLKMKRYVCVLFYSLSFFDFFLCFVMSLLLSFWVPDHGNPASEYYSFFSHWLSSYLISVSKIAFPQTFKKVSEQDYIHA